MARKYRGIKFDAAEEKKIVRAVIDAYNKDKSDREDWSHQRERLYKKYRGITDAKNFPWPGCSNLHLPITMSSVETIVPRLVNPLFARRPYASVKPRKVEFIEKAPQVERFLDWALSEEINFQEIVEDWIRGMTIDGPGIVKVIWSKETRRTKRKTETLEFDVVLGAEGVSYQPRLEENEIESEEVVYEAPKVYYLDLEDVFYPADAEDLQSCHHVIHRSWNTLDYIKRMQEMGLFQQVEVPEQGTSRDSEGKVPKLKRELEGLDEVRTDDTDKKREMLEGYFKYDINGDGLEEELIFTVDRDSEKLFGAYYLETIFPHGMRPFVAVKFLPVSGQFNCIGVPELVEPIQDEANAIHNQRVDFGTITNTPFGWYRAASGYKPEIHTIEPGKLFPVDQVGDVQLHQGGNIPWGEREEFILLAYLERLLGISDFTAGRQIDRPNAPKTATATLAIIQEGQVRLERVMQRVALGFKELVLQILELYKFYLPENKFIRVATEEGVDFVPITKEDLDGEFDISVEANLNAGNTLLEQQNALQLYSQLRGDELFDPRINPEGAVELRRKVLRSFGETEADKMVSVAVAQKVEQLVREQQAQSENGRGGPAGSGFSTAPIRPAAQFEMQESQEPEL